MGVVVEREVWAPSLVSYLLLCVSCLASLSLIPFFSLRSASPAASYLGGPAALFLRFQRSFLLLYSLASVTEGLQSVFGEYDYEQYGINREKMVMSLSAGATASLLLGPFSGVLSDLIGSRKACVLFSVLHLIVGVMKSLSKHPFVWITSVCLALARSIFSFCFETWMVTEHEKQGHKQDFLNDTFWLMTFSESVSLVVGQVLANLVVKDVHEGFLTPSALSVLLAIIILLYIKKEWSGCHKICTIANYRKSFSGHILNDKRVHMLALAHASIHFSVSVFWIIWAPAIVADGREVQLSLIYPCFLGSRMLGSTIFPWFFGGMSSLHNDDCLIGAFIVGGVALLMVAYDYQEIGFLVTLFCIFHACVGFILPSLARLRTMYVPNELRGSMISFSIAPANAAILWAMIQGGYCHIVGNSCIIALSSIWLLVSAGCIHVLRRWRRHPHHDWHSL